MWIDGKYHCSISPKGYGLKNVNGKLTDEQVMEIRKMYIPYKTSCQDIANLYEVSRNCIYSIISKRTFKYLAD
jgi:predicted DNA-binding protein YlxM (UPF0122 family)